MGVIDVKEIKGHVFFSKKLVSGIRELKLFCIFADAINFQRTI